MITPLKKGEEGIALFKSLLTLISFYTFIILVDHKIRSLTQFPVPFKKEEGRNEYLDG